MPEFKVGGLVMTKNLPPWKNGDGFIVPNGIVGELKYFERNPHTGAKAAGIVFPSFTHNVGVDLTHLIPLNDPDTDTSDQQIKELEHA